MLCVLKGGVWCVVRVKCGVWCRVVWTALRGRSMLCGDLPAMNCIRVCV